MEGREQGLGCGRMAWTTASVGRRVGLCEGGKMLGLTPKSSDGGQKSELSRLKRKVEKSSKSSGAQKS